MSGFKGALVVQKVGPRTFQLTVPLVYELDERITFVVPAGFVTDFASIPQIFYITTPPIGAYDLAAVLHDWLYRYQPCSRSQADGIFRQAMKDSGVDWYTRNKMWLAVRIGGGLVWDRYTTDRDEAA